VSNPNELFRKDVEAMCADTTWQQRFSAARRQHEISFEEALTQFSNLETARRRAAFARWKALENLDSFLIQFEAAFIRLGGKVIWARDKNEACREVMDIIGRSGAKTIVKSKTLTSEEIGLDEALGKLPGGWTETDLGQYILQLSGDTPTHPVMPALHKSREEVKILFAEKLGVESDPDAAALSAAAAGKIRDVYTRTDIGITGANFLVAAEGAIAITENEGNAMLAAARPRIHIAIAGIDKVIPALSDLHVLWPLLASYGTGQMISAYNSVITGPRKNGDMDGPEEMYVVLVDNGRTAVLAQELQRNVLSCIRCGACHFADPVFRIISGHPYRSAWMGPPGAIVQPLMKGMKSHGFYNDLSTLSGADTDVCPVNISFNRMVLENRRQALEEQAAGTGDKLFYFLWKRATLKREIYNWKSLRPRNFFMNGIFLKSPQGLRTMRPVAKQSFNEIWRKRMGS
jgi:L-lactate dehydrogenase complex protein LldF